MKNIVIFHKKRPIELKLKGSKNKLILELISFKTYQNKLSEKKENYHFISLKPLNLETFDYFTTKILYFYIRKELKKYMNLFYIQENFYFELID